MKVGMRIAVATFAASGLIAAGCGGGDAEESGSGSPEDAVKSFFGALNDGDGARACELITAESVEQIELAGDECADVAAEGAEGEIPDDFEVSDVNEDGDSATATVSGDDETFEVPLTKDGDDWKVDYIGFLSSALSEASDSGDATTEDLTAPDITTP